MIGFLFSFIQYEDGEEEDGGEEGEYDEDADPDYNPSVSLFLINDQYIFIQGQIKKMYVFLVTLPYLIFLVKPSKTFHIFSKKTKKSGMNGIKYSC